MLTQEPSPSLMTIGADGSARDPEATSSRPLHVVLALKALSFGALFLPKRVHRALYDHAFETYRRHLRRRYFARLAQAEKTEDKRKIVFVHESMPHSLVGWQGLELTYDAVLRSHKTGLAGDLVECGVAEGGSALLMARVTQELAESPKKLWLFDSFEGLPEPTDEDYKNGRTGSHVRPLPKGSCLGTLAQVQSLLFDDFKLDRDRIELVKGWFQDTLPKTRDRIDQIAVLRLDGDWYESTKVCLAELFNKVVDGGIVILDDYYSCYGCRRATDEFLQKLGVDYPINPDGRGGAFFVKTP